MFGNASEPGPGPKSTPAVIGSDGLLVGSISVPIGERLIPSYGLPDGAPLVALTEATAALPSTRELFNALFCPYAKPV